MVLPDNTLFNIDDHVTGRRCGRSPSAHLMENSLKLLKYIPSATVFGSYLDFGVGNVKDVTKNISQTLCVTNHQEEEAYVQWSPGLLKFPSIKYSIDLKCLDLIVISLSMT